MKNSFLHNYDVFIFDLDGTLIDTKAAEKYAVSKIEEVATAKIDFYNEYAFLNSTQWELYEKGEIDVEELLEKPWKEFLKQHKNECLDATMLNKMFFTFLSEKDYTYPNASEALKTLSALDKKVYIASSGIEEWQDFRVQNSTFAKYVLMTVGADSGAMKPKKEFFDKLFFKIGLRDLKRVLFVGDSLKADILGGNQVGLDTCWFNPSKSCNTTDIIPKYEIENLSELIKN